MLFLFLPGRPGCGVETGHFPGFFPENQFHRQTGQPECLTHFIFEISQVMRGAIGRIVDEQQEPGRQIADPGCVVHLQRSCTDHRRRTLFKRIGQHPVQERRADTDTGLFQNHCRRIQDSNELHYNPRLDLYTNDTNPSLALQSAIKACYNYQ